MDLIQRPLLKLIESPLQINNHSLMMIYFGRPMASRTKDAKIQKVMQQDLPYDEYQKRYKAIMGR